MAPAVMRGSGFRSNSKPGMGMSRSISSAQGGLGGAGVVQAQQKGAPVANVERGDRSRVGGQALEHVERQAQGKGDRPLDHVAVTETGDDRPRRRVFAPQRL